MSSKGHRTAPAGGVAATFGRRRRASNCARRCPLPPAPSPAARERGRIRSRFGRCVAPPSPTQFVGEGRGGGRPTIPHHTESCPPHHPSPAVGGGVDRHCEERAKGRSGERAPKGRADSRRYILPPSTLSPFHPFTLSPFHPFTLSPFHPFTLSPNRNSEPEPRTHPQREVAELVHLAVAHLGRHGNVPADAVVGAKAGLDAGLVLMKEGAE